MKKTKEKFQDFIKEAKNNSDNEDQFLESLRSLTPYETVDEMIKRFAELADIEE